jgi:hypothetical protein
MAALLLSNTNKVYVNAEKAITCTPRNTFGKLSIKCKMGAE